MRPCSMGMCWPPFLVRSVGKLTWIWVPMPRSHMYSICARSVDTSGCGHLVSWETRWLPWFVNWLVPSYLWRMSLCMLVLHKGLVFLLLAMCACMGQSSVILTSCAPCQLSPRFWGMYLSIPLRLLMLRWHGLCAVHVVRMLASTLVSAMGWTWFSSM